MLTHFNDIPASERIIVALDCDAAEAKRLAGLLAGKARWLKVGMTLYYAEGPSIVKAFKDLGFDVFLDLKFHDIPHQVEGAAASAVASGADMLTMHASGGVAMMQAAQRGVERVCAQTGRDLPATLGITVLTSMDEPTLKRIGVERAMEEQVGALALLAKESGISGVVASPQEARMLRDILGPDAYIVTPGVRPAGSAKGDQSRIATPADAFAAGASHIVVGRSPRPRIPQPPSMRSFRPYSVVSLASKRLMGFNGQRHFGNRCVQVPCIFPEMPPSALCLRSPAW